MKLFDYDTKHGQVNGEVDLGNLSEKEVNLVNKVIAFLAEQKYTDGRYKNIALAGRIDVCYDEADEYKYLVLRNRR